MKYPVCALALTSFVAACHGTSPTRGTPAGGSSTGGASPAAASQTPRDAGRDPWVQIDAAPDTPAARQARVKAALARVGEIMPRLAKLRGLTFEHDIPREFQRQADFKAFVAREIAKSLPPARSHAISEALFQIGLLAKPVDLAEVEAQAFTTQAGAYYDPAVKRFFLVVAPDSAMMLDTISAHELTHGLQDQHFDLQKLLPEKPDGSEVLDDDAASARHFLAEGDATFTMFLFALARGKAEIPPLAVKLLRGQIDQFAAMDLPALTKMEREQAAAFTSMDPEIKQSIAAMDQIPPVVLEPMIDSYMKGAKMVLAAYDHGGWPAVNALYTDPPASTEQALHPEAKLVAARDRPHHVTIPAPRGAEVLTDNVMGELLWRVYFELWTPKVAARAAAGWGGDRYAVIRQGGHLIGLLATVWDSPAEAKEFADAYVATLPVRFPGADTTDPAHGVARPGGKVFVRTVGAKVYIADGAPDVRALDALVRTAKFD